MKTIIISIFNNEAKALKSLASIKQLKDAHSIKVYDTAIVEKSSNEEAHLIQRSGSRLTGLFLGAFSGAILGLFGGPAGVLMGAFSGTLFGLLVDSCNAIIKQTFLEDLSNNLNSGTYALVVNADEDSTSLVESELETLDARIYSTPKSKIIRNFFKSDKEELFDELYHLEVLFSESSMALNNSIKTKLNKHNRLLQDKKFQVGNRLKALQTQLLSLFF